MGAIGRCHSWRSAAAIPGVTVHVDHDGGEARRFGAETSGFVVLYDAHGELLFAGGITTGRGQAGDNAETAGIGHRRDKLGTADPLHATLHDRMADAQHSGDGVAHAQFPVNRAARFSKNALTPSL